MVTLANLYNPSLPATQRDYSSLTNEQFQREMGYVGDKARNELGQALTDWYNTYTGGKGMGTQLQSYLDMLNGRDGTYLPIDYQAAKDKMLNDARAAGLYDVGGTPNTSSINNWSRETTTPAQGWFNTYATGFTPENSAVDFWNKKVSDVGYDSAFSEFLNPVDQNAPRYNSMKQDQDWVNRTGYQAPTATKPVSPTQPVTNPPVAATPTTPPSQPGLSNLFPRQNWGNFQGTNRGARYFDQGTGNYSLSNLRF